RWPRATRRSLTTAGSRYCTQNFIEPALRGGFGRFEWRLQAEKSLGSPWWGSLGRFGINPERWGSST
ncbi:MAG: hypothetical protein LH616_00315, partial [Ilumatobacteraceae bacterium]|nr:hypothetical protein [Ilumatobacteraceae bacterium]